MRLNSPQINLITRACMKASRSLIRDFGEVEKLQVSFKGPNNFVTNADRKVEKIIIEELEKSKKPLSDKLLLNIARYINNITIEIITILKNDFICISDINIFLSPPINFRYAINGMLPDKIKIIEVISIYEFLK